MYNVGIVTSVGWLFLLGGRSVDMSKFPKNNAGKLHLRAMLLLGHLFHFCLIGYIGLICKSFGYFLDERTPLIYDADIAF